jgi:hypothetical protein
MSEPEGKRWLSSKRHPPRLATWLLLHFMSGRWAESLAGDLIEEFKTGRGAAWYWALYAVVAGRADGIEFFDLARVVRELPGA